MDNESLVTRQWFGKIDADGIPSTLFVDGEVFARCTRCKIYKHPEDTLLLTCEKKRTCRLCKSKENSARRYEKTKTSKKRLGVLLKKCNHCNQFTKTSEWNGTKKCCKDCGRRLKKESQKLPKCKQCGAETKGKQFQFCSVKCMTDAKKKRHVVQCVQCQKQMEVQEYRKKVRSYFLCSKECIVDFNAKKSDAARQRKQHALEELQRNRNEQRRLFEIQNKNGWLTKCRNAKRHFNYNESTVWTRKCASAVQGMKKRCTSQKYRIAVFISWSCRVGECRRSLYGSALRGSLTHWQKKASNASGMMKQRMRFKNAIN